MYFRIWVDSTRVGENKVAHPRNVFFLAVTRPSSRPEYQSLSWQTTGITGQNATFPLPAWMSQMSQLRSFITVEFSRAAPRSGGGCNDVLCFKCLVHDESIDQPLRGMPKGFRQPPCDFESMLLPKTYCPNVRGNHKLYCME